MGDETDEQAASGYVAAEIRRIEQQMQQLQQQLQPQQKPAIGDIHAPHAYYQNRAAIIPPIIERQDYEIKPQMIALVKQHLFHGLAAENPMEHVEDFEEICSTTGSNGVPPDFLKCKLFSFSLADKALRWLKSLAPGSLATWADARSAFLDKFYTKSKTAALRNKISSFQQQSGEAFCEAWERYKEYRRDCPHHGFSDEQILSTFYDGVDWESRNALNAASNGNFYTRSKEGAFELIENLATSSGNRCHEYDENRYVSSVESQKIDELAAKVSLLLERHQRSVQLCANRSYEQYAEVNYVNEGYVENQSFQAQASNSHDELKSLMQLVLLSQQKSANEINVKVDSMYNDLHSKFEAVCTHVKKLEIQVAKNAEASGIPPEKAEVNPWKGYVNAVETRSGKTGQTAATPAQKSEKGKERAAEYQLQRNQNALREGHSSEHPSSPTEHMLPRDAPTKPAENLPARVYIPKVPYPVLPRDQLEPINAKKLADFKKMVRRIPEEISFEEALKNRPILDFFRNCRETEEEIKAVFVEARSTPPLRVLPKVEDPGKFLVPCSITGVKFKEALCDSGSSVNLMSKALAEKLKISEIRPSRMNLRFANSSSTTSSGSIHDLPVQIGDCLVPTDFQVAEMREGYDMHLLLGRPFMATVGAIIDMPNKRVCFSKIDKTVFYKAVPTGTITHASCISAVDREEAHAPIPLAPAPPPGKFRAKAKTRENVQSKRITGGPQMTLIPQGYDGNSVDYKVKCKGHPKSFSRVRAILPSELKEKGIGVVNAMLSTVLNMRMPDYGVCFGASSEAPPD